MPKQETRPRGRPRSGPDPERFREILEAAADVFLRSGYDGASIQDIADEVGILKGSLYYYVATKEDFLFEIVKGVFERALEAIAPVRDSTAPALERLQQYVRLHIEFTVSNQKYVAIRMREFQRLSPERSQLITEEGASYVEILRSILIQGQAEGTVADDLDASLVSLGLLGMLNSVTTWYEPTGRSSVEEIIEQYTRLVLEGVSTN